MSAAADACGRPAARRVLRVNAPATLAMRWLIPRLERFHTARPEVEVLVTTATTLHDELRGGFDIAIRRGLAQPSAWPQYRAAPFLAESETLIVSPVLFERAPLREPADVANHVLLASETRPGDWVDWLNRAGVPQRPEQRRRVFDHQFVTLQAVSDGLGLGIGPLPILQADLDLGRFLAPFPDILTPRTGYVALVPFDAYKTPSTAAFIASERSRWRGKGSALAFHRRRRNALWSCGDTRGGVVQASDRYPNRHRSCRGDVRIHEQDTDRKRRVLSRPDSNAGRSCLLRLHGACA
jgi:DNA-binding transcriptional LysR family regulator